MASDGLVVDRAARRGGSCLSWVLFAGLLVSAALCLVAPAASATTPGVNTLKATSVDYTTATLNGDVDPNGEETKAYFEYGATVAYGSKTSEVSVGSGSSPVERAQALSGLSPNTTYHYRVVATNGSGTALGVDRTFVTGWAVQTMANPETENMLRDVSCSSASECTAVGYWGAQRWDGSSWKVQTGGAAEAVSCVSSTACFSISSGSAAFWNGTEWKAQTTPTPTGMSLKDISCSSATECTAVGSYSSSGTKTLAMRWNGAEWKLQTTPNPAGSHSVLTAVSCTSASFCMATGYFDESELTPYAPLSMLWNGSEWTIKSAPNPGGKEPSWFYGVSCVSATQCVGVGQKQTGGYLNETMAQRWNGTEWKVETTPNPEAIERRFEEVSCTTATACTAVGAYSNNLGEEFPFALRWNGTAWALQSMPRPAGATKAVPFGLSCIASRGCVAVGHHRNGAAFKPLAIANWRSAMPTVTTKAASGVAEKAATLSGTVNPNGNETKAYFEYGTTTAYGSKSGEVNAGSGTSAVEKSLVLSGLSANTTYHYRMVANNENPEPARGADTTFTTIGPPQVTTGAGEPEAATGESAVLNATVDPNGQSTTYQFEVGTSSGSYSTTVPIPAASAGSETTGKAVSHTIAGLTRGTKYFFRVTATNASGKVNGAESSFVTQNVPGAVTEGVSLLRGSGATLSAAIDTNGLGGEYKFEYGTTASYGTKSSAVAYGATPELTSVARDISGLKPTTTYHYRVVVENGLGTTYGEDKTFTTLKAGSIKNGGGLVPVGTSIRAAGALSFAGVSCAGTEFSGLLSENPGALQNVSSAKVQGSGGAMCTYAGIFNVKFEVPTKDVAIVYTTNETGEQGIIKWSKFTLLGTFYGPLGNWAGTCDYEVAMSASVPLPSASVFPSSGTVTQVKSIGECPGSGGVTGKVRVTEGATVLSVGA
jgi:phosphodiesterase/alkaline phosphatase D-like protein